MKFKDINGLSTDELKRKSSELRGDLFQMKMKNVLGQLGNPIQIRDTRKAIAKVETAIRQKQENR